jgi:hypothetical protein
VRNACNNSNDTNPSRPAPEQVDLPSPFYCGGLVSPLGSALGGSKRFCRRDRVAPKQIMKPE